MRKRYSNDEIAKMNRYINCDVSGCGVVINEGDKYYSTPDGWSVCSKHFSQQSAEGQMVVVHVFNGRAPIVGFIHNGKIEKEV